MKKCAKCNIVFHSEDRTRCLYCDTLLMDSEEGAASNSFNYYDAGGFHLGKTIITKILGDQEDVVEHGRMQFVISSYFRSRTFHFMYAFSRNHYLMGKKFPRTFIQPIGLFSLLMIPWALWNLIDTFFVRMLYHGYCDVCQWKYVKFSGAQDHDPRYCEYNKEYEAIIRDILSGDITKTEDGFKDIALAKRKQNKRSAYNDLCSSKKYMSWLLDIICIWFSISLMILAVVMTLLPHFSVWVHSLADSQVTY